VETSEFDMASLERRLDGVPLLAARPRSVELLTGGLTNVNVKVTTPEGRFVARCFASDPELLGIDREAEHLNSRAAAQAGVGAPVRAFRPDLGMLVIDYLDGVTYENADFGRPGVVRRVAEACRRLHSGPRFVNEFDMFLRQRTYRDIVVDNGFALPSGYHAYDEHFQRMRTVLAAVDDRGELDQLAGRDGRRGTVPCNNDLLAGNFVDDGDRLWLIDYEYSGNNDPCFELGNVAAECDLDDDQLEELVTSYYGRRLRHKNARVRLQKLASQYGWSLWGSIQAATSPSDFDFTAWCTERFEKAAAGFTTAAFPVLLEEAQRAD
jgi:thiamine kinase-like enzyme